MRAGTIQTQHSIIQTPVFMPVGTQGSVKALTMQQMESLDAQVLLANTYHLYLRPGSERVERLGGLHGFTTWKRPFLTDSGGYQVSSLGLFRDTGLEQLTRITDEGVYFRSHLDGSKHFIGPEESMKIQAQLGADIVMAFDEATPISTQAYSRQAMERTHRWLERSLESFVKQQEGRRKRGVHTQAIFGIIQGGDFEALRRESTQFVIGAGTDGIAVGGATIGQSDAETERNVAWIRDLLPKAKPLYLMGVGVSPQAAVAAVQSGADMFDCVAPTKLARSGLLYIGKLAVPDDDPRQAYFDSPISSGRINLTNTRFADDSKPIDPDCPCSTCSAGYSRAYLRHLLKAKELAYYQLATMHNLDVMLRTVTTLRNYIVRFSERKNSIAG
jgi:queuine tRNA-ribosyltransferase